MKHEHAGKSSEEIVNSNKIIENITKSKTILDAGCGPGHVTFAIEKKFPKSQIFAFDKHIQSINNVKENSKADAKVVDLTKKWPLENESVDTTILCMVLHGFVANDETDRVLNELSRVTKPQGDLILVDFTTPRHNHMSTIPPTQAIKLLKKYGFKLKTEFNPGKQVYGQVFEKNNQYRI